MIKGNRRIKTITTLLSILVAVTITNAVDFNGDGKPDYLLFNPTTRQTAIWYLNGTMFVSGVLGPTPPAGWTLQGGADFNGDGRPDYALFNPSTRQTALWYLNGAALAGGVLGPTLPAGYSFVSP